MRLLFVHSLNHRGRVWRTAAPLLLTLLFMLAACGSPAGGVVAHRPPPTPTVTPAPKITPPPTPIVTPAPKPTATPPHVQSGPQNAPPPPPPILDVRPAAMSIVGHLDCARNGVFICQAEVISRSSNQTGLHWIAFTNVPGHITFSPVSGTLSPGQTLLVTISVPLNDCTPGLFFFRGPANTHTISWAC